MHLTALFAALAATSAYACSRLGDATDCIEPFVPHCGSLPPSKKTIKLRNIWMRDAPGNVSQPITVETYFHLIYSKDRSKKDFNKNYIAQLDTLNRDFAPHGISFKLKDKPNYVKNAKWAVGRPWASDVTKMRLKDHPEFKMRSKLRKGDAKTMNIYFIPGLMKNNKGLWGMTMTTDWLRTQDFHNFNPSLEESQIADGVVVDAYSMHGARDDHFRYLNGTVYCYNCDHRAEKVVTHEVGHWMGLWHTFQGGCEETDGGDQVLDTPPQMEQEGPQTYAHTVNTCPAQSGFDSIHNYMNYLPDECLTEFTPGQQRLMHDYWKHERVGSPGHQYRNRKSVIDGPTPKRQNIKL